MHAYEYDDTLRVQFMIITSTEQSQRYVASVPYVRSVQVQEEFAVDVCDAEYSIWWRCVMNNGGLLGQDSEQA